VIFTDALSEVTALKRQHSNNLNDLLDSLENLTKSYQKVVIQFVPAHCAIAGNEEADKLAKQGGGLQQEDLGSMYKMERMRTTVANLRPTEVADNDCQRPGQRRKADQNLLHLPVVLLVTDHTLILAKRVGKSTGHTRC
jgi:hypothetical protein